MHIMHTRIVYRPAGHNVSASAKLAGHICAWHGIWPLADCYNAHWGCMHSCLSVWPEALKECFSQMCVDIYSDNTQATNHISYFWLLLH